VRVLEAVRAVLTAWHRVQARSPSSPPRCAGRARRDLTAQVNALVAPGFVTAAGPSAGDLARLQAAELRIDSCAPIRSATQWTAEVRTVADEYAAELAALPAGVEPSGAAEIRWMIEGCGRYAHLMRTGTGVGEADPEGAGRAAAVATEVAKHK
jgi:ATP-dependent helicase HrpA